ncbi:MAG: hypothetical protein IJQ20_01075 [Paludibacteraceae bacterium]|nr:hypothetical protein [Paludibacteraceae bacterium]
MFASFENVWDLLLKNLWFPLLVASILYALRTFNTKRKEMKAIEEEKDGLLNDCFRKLGDKRQAEILEKEYIPIKGQKKSPHNNTDKLDIASDSERYDLVSTILNEISPKKGEINKNRLRFTILAGNGMGKSIFAAALAKAYFKWDFYKNNKLPYDFCVINLFGNVNISDIETELQSKTKSKLILVLDSLDENKYAIEDRSKSNENGSKDNDDDPNFINKLEKVTNEVQVVIILGRTQFFEKAEDELTEGTIAQSSDLMPFLEWDKYYISPLTTNEMQHYVDIKFRDKVGSPEFKRACELITKGHTDIMRRPLILSYLDDIVKIQFVRPDKPTNAEIYHVIIENWLNREVSREKNRGNLLPTLYDFTKQIAVYIYEQKNGFVLSQEDYETFLKYFGYKEEPYSFKERSLLNRTDDGYIKFAHKSFFEYFIAIDSLENPVKQYDPRELDMAKVFAQELQDIYLQKCRYDYINMAESPFKYNSLQSPLVDETHKRDDLFDEWSEYIEDFSTEENPEELRNANLYYLRRYRNDLLLDLHVLSFSFTRREAKLHYISDKLASHNLNAINKDLVDDYRTIERQISGNMYFGKRMLDENIFAFSSVKDFQLSKINYRENVIFPAIGAGELKPDEFAYAVGYGFVSSDEEVFKTIKRLISHEANDIAFKLDLRHKDHEDDDDPDTTITIYPSVVLVYKELQTIKQQVEYISSLKNYIGDLPLGKEIIINFYTMDYNIYYLLDYNSILYNHDQIKQCLKNTIEAVKIGLNMDKNLYNAYNSKQGKKQKEKTTKTKKSVRRNHKSY